MTPSFSSKSLKPYLALALLWCALSVFFLSRGPLDPKPFIGFPLDDAWIHFDFSRNLASGNCFGLNPQEPSSGSTSPLWVLLLAGFFNLGVPFEISGIALGMLFLFLTALVIYKMAFLITEDSRTAFISSILVLVCGRFLWGVFSGMEVALFSFLSALGIMLHLKNIPQGRLSLLPAVVFGLASLSRPEGHLLFALAFVDLAARNFRRKQGLRWMAGYLVIYAALVLPYMVFSWLLTHKLICSSYYSKMLFTWRVSALPYLKGYVKYIFWDNPFLALFLISGLRYSLSRRCYLLVAWMVLYPLAASQVSPILIHHARYQMPLIPLYAMVGYFGLRRLFSRRTAHVYLVLVVVWGLFQVNIWGQRYTKDALSFYKQHFQVAGWLREHTAPAEAVATNDIGILSYATGRKVVDLCGIINPDIINILSSDSHPRFQRRMLWHYLARHRVKYLAFYRSWFPWMYDERCLKKVYEVNYPFNTSAACDTMEVFEVLCVD
ncbi:MAG: hypothetical protein WC732_03435 [Candidatus Omnitrophota bacterium]